MKKVHKSDINEIGRETFDFKACNSLPITIRTALYRSKMEEIELKLALLRRSKEQNEPVYIIKQLINLIGNVVHLKNYLLIKKEGLKEICSKLDPGQKEKLDEVADKKKREGLVISRIQDHLTKIGLHLFIYKFRKERLGQRFEIKLVPDKSMIVASSEEKDIYYPKN